MEIIILSMSKRVQIHPTKSEDRSREQRIAPTINEIEYDRFEELRNQYGFTSDAQAARYFISIGMKSIVENDPRNNTDQPTKDRESAPMIRDFIPEGKENAIDLFEEVPEEIRNNIIDIVQEDPEIERDKNEVYR